MTSSTVLPLASRALAGGGLYGATLAAGSLAAVLVLAAGPGALASWGPARMLLVATSMDVAGVIVAATAPSMSLVLGGSVLRGLGGGLLASFGVSAVGSLYEDALRPRVLGMFAVTWLLPAMAGAPLAGVLAAMFGWRWAMAAPVAVLLAARVVVGRQARLIRWEAGRERIDLSNSILVLSGLVVASAGAGQGGWPGAMMLAAGVLLAAGASWRVLARAAGTDGPRFRVMVAFLGLCLAFFGGNGLISLAVIDGLGRGVMAASAALAVGLTAWSLAGLLPARFGQRLGDASTTGLGFLAGGLAAEAAAQLCPAGPALRLALAVIGWGVAGLGMGLSYPRLSAQPFDDLPPQRAVPVGTAIAFAEAAGTAIGSLLGGGIYSLAQGSRHAASASVGQAYLLMTATAVAAGVISARRFHAKPG